MNIYTKTILWLNIKGIYQTVTVSEQNSVKIDLPKVKLTSLFCLTLVSRHPVLVKLLQDPL